MATRHSTQPSHSSRRTLDNPADLSGPSPRGNAPARLGRRPPRILLFGAALLGLAVAAHAQPGDHTCSDYEEARAVVADLGRIVSPDGIQESFKIRIGGIDQWVYVRGQDRKNPILLFVHGGPASPMSAAIWQFQRPIEEYFTVVHWDQRGAGRTYLASDPAKVADTIRIDRYVDDTIELTTILEQRYGVTKVVLVGHSWGSIVGLKAATSHPELYSAYVGIGQVINTRENERLSYAYAVGQARRAGNTEALAELASIAPYPGETPINRERIVIARKWAQYYGGLSAFRESSSYYFGAPLLSPEYTPSELTGVDEGNVFTLAKILPEFLAVDFNGLRELPIPVVMLLGRHDYTTPSEPTEAWLARLKAPFKRVVWFERSAHLIPFEEPGKTLVTLLELVRPLTDPTIRRPEGRGALRAPGGA